MSLRGSPNFFQLFGWLIVFVFCTSLEVFATASPCARDAGRILKDGTAYVPPEVLARPQHWRDLFAGEEIPEVIEAQGNTVHQVFAAIMKNLSGPRQIELLGLLKTHGPGVVLEKLAQNFEASDFDSKFTRSLNPRGLVRAFGDLLRKEVKFQEPQVVVVLNDVAFLKLMNKLGYNEADASMRELEAISSKQLRPEDSFGRWGGDEFVHILNTTEENAELLMSARIMRHREAIFERFSGEIERLYSSNFEFRRMVDNAIGDGPISRAHLNELGLGLLNSLPDAVFNQSGLTAIEKIKSGIVVLGSVRSGYATVDLRGLEPEDLTDQRIEEIFYEALGRAQKDLEHRREKEAGILKLNSRPQGL